MFKDKNKSPLKILNFQYSKKGHDILIDNNVHVEAVDRLDFSCADVFGDNVKIKKTLGTVLIFKLSMFKEKLCKLNEKPYVNAVNFNCREISLIRSTQ